ncbi:polysaccharide lyase 8 family protein [Phytohabitans sp. ZYX-F-186]|uniref:Polysaccharide lyase 8 family protein n=1 Tax=Phytohabitans maris TaxID=3071409 RepID=A0ABU0ZMK4_9ACTN|nr:polysaccharide lyase 8 family protein [Phytohabitans sp. ZYX-F-186]MDQ7908263.1 polysaccharide lyase 8 family protein [Phytohabitans sp. ZYX-F-186]
MRSLDRRTLLIGGLAAGGAALGAGLPDRPARAGGRTDLAAAADDFARMRALWRALHVTSGYDPADPGIAPVLTTITGEAQRWWSAMAKSSSRTYLWSDAQLGVHQSFAIRDSFARLRAMALAWATPGSGLAGRDDLRADTVAGLDWVVGHWCNENRDPVGNWCFYRDGSFIQHHYYPYAGAYGASILDALAPVLRTVAGTPWQVDAPIVVEWLREAFDPLIWRGGFMDMTRGRTIARPDEQSPVTGHATPAAALGLLGAAPAAETAWLRSLLKEWMLADGYRADPTPARNVPLRLAARVLLDDATVTRRGPLAVSKVYHHQDRVVHRRADWALAIAMHSSRIANFEYLNGENTRGWITADGATYLYTAAEQYGDAYWPTVNSARLAGTTIDVRSRAAGEGDGYRSGVNWAGGATLDGRYTAAGMNLDAQGSSLTAKKSWFCFDREVVALGARINATDGRRVETTVDNRQISASGAEKLLVNGVERVAQAGWVEEPQTRWVHIGGTGGYVFPTPTLVDFRREARTGRWTDVNTHPTYAGYTGALTRNYLAAWIDHGTDPANAGYAYVILPTATPEQTAAYAARPDAVVVANTASVQAARSSSARVLAANFWAAASASVVTSLDPGSVVLMEGDGEIAVAVADPTHQASRIRLTVDLGATRVVAADPGITVTALAPLTFTVSVAGAAGATRTLRAAR